MTSHANYLIVKEDEKRGLLLIKDMGPWDKHLSVTNDAEWVVQCLSVLGVLPKGRRLFYFDSEGEVAELLHAEGKFVRFGPGSMDDLE